MVAGWLVAAAAATATGVAAVAVIGDSIAGPSGDVLSASDIEHRLDEAPGGTPAIDPTGTPTATPSRTAATPKAVTKVHDNVAARVAAHCEGSVAVLDTWAPKNGYGLREVDRPRGTEAEVSFARDGQRVDVQVTCSGGVPRFADRIR